MVLLEAMAARTVVVASDIDGYRAAAGDCAVLVPPGDPEALAAALAGPLGGRLAPPGGPPNGAPGEGRQARDRKGWLDRGSERAEMWSMEALAGRYERIYRAAVVGAGRWAAGHCSGHE